MYIIHIYIYTYRHIYIYNILCISAGHIGENLFASESRLVRAVARVAREGYYRAINNAPSAPSRRDTEGEFSQKPPLLRSPQTTGGEGDANTF